MIDPLFDSTPENDVALHSAALDMLNALERVARMSVEYPDRLSPDSPLAKCVNDAIAKARGGSVAEVAPVVAVSVETCWHCAHNTAFNLCEVIGRFFVDDAASDLADKTGEWIDNHIPRGANMMPARENVPACPGFKRTVKS